MTAKTRSTIISDADTNLPDNNVGEITAADIRNSIKDLADSSLFPEDPVPTHTHSNATTSVSGFMSSTDKSKLDGIQSGAQVNPSTSDIFTAIKGVDGPGSGLDADTVDGIHGTAFAQLNQSNPTFTDAVTLKYSDNTHYGYVNFNKANGNTGGYIGWGNGSDTIHISGINATILDIIALEFKVGGYKTWNAGSLVGTVSQSSGIPTGSVIEKGSNSNGSYIRFADGTQICSNRYTTSITGWNLISGGTYWSEITGATFPSAFAATPFLTACAYDGNVSSRSAYLSFAGCNTSGITSAYITNAASSTTTTTNIGINYIAFGRWY